jgi:hypothetical protein
MNLKKLSYNHGGFILVLCGYLFYKEPTVLDFIDITNVVEPLNKGYFILFYFIEKCQNLQIRVILLGNKATININTLKANVI